MGGGTWSDDEHAVKSATKASRVANGGAAFAYTHAVNTGVAPAKVSDRLDPKRVAGPSSPYAGQVMRESRDSDSHPESLAIAVMFDVTGSMGSVPIALEKKLKGLMTLLIKKGYVEHPQILFGANGDANCDRAPLQIGQFESAADMDDDLDAIYVEGGGGGQSSETYELGLYFIARHTSTDCFDKRGKKGYLFTIGDENYYSAVHQAHIGMHIGDHVQANIPTSEIVKELREKWHVFHIIAEQGGYPHDARIEQSWKDLLGGEYVLKLEDTDNVAELIGLTIGLTEGTTDLDAATTDLKDIGVDAHGIKSVTTALATVARSTGGLTKATVTGTLPAPVGAVGGTDRL